MEVRLWRGQYELMKSEAMFTFLICGRGFGKSFVVAHKIFQEALAGRPCIVVSPTFKQLTFSIFGELRTLLRSVPAEWSFNSQMNTFEINGTPVYGFTANNGNYENMRGMSAASLFLDEAREYDKIVMDTAIPCLRGFGRPKIYVTSSPKGMNWLGVEVKRRLRENDPDFKLITGTSYENESLDKSFFQMMERNLYGDFLRQELYGEIVDSDMEDTLFGYSLLDAMNDAKRDGTPYADELAVIGLDCARFGGDQTCGVLRIGRRVVAIRRLGRTDTGEAVDLVRKLADACKATGVKLDCVCVDAAYGGGVIDMLRTLKYKVFEVNFSERSPDSNYYNMRAFMYFTAKRWIEEGGFARDEALREDLSAQRYFIHADKSFRLIPKEMLKKSLGRSPDTSDAFALTFHSGALAMGADLNRKKSMDDPAELARVRGIRIRKAAHSFSFGGD